MPRDQARHMRDAYSSLVKLAGHARGLLRELLALWSLRDGGRWELTTRIGDNVATLLVGRDAKQPEGRRSDLDRMADQTTIGGLVTGMSTGSYVFADYSVLFLLVSRTCVLLRALASDDDGDKAAMAQEVARYASELGFKIEYDAEDVTGAMLEERADVLGNRTRFGAWVSQLWGRSRGAPVLADQAAVSAVNGSVETLCFPVFDVRGEGRTFRRCLVFSMRPLLPLRGLPFVGASGIFLSERARLGTAPIYAASDEDTEDLALCLLADTEAKRLMLEINKACDNREGALLPTTIRKNVDATKARGACVEASAAIDYLWASLVASAKIDGSSRQDWLQYAAEKKKAASWLVPEISKESKMRVAVQVSGQLFRLVRLDLDARPRVTRPRVTTSGKKDLDAKAISRHDSLEKATKFLELHGFVGGGPGTATHWTIKPKPRFGSEHDDEFVVVPMALLALLAQYPKDKLYATFGGLYKPADQDGKRACFVCGSSELEDTTLEFRVGPPNDRQLLEALAAPCAPWHKAAGK
jgi:hypothetical protein